MGTSLNPDPGVHTRSDPDAKDKWIRPESKLPGTALTKDWENRVRPDIRYVLPEPGEVSRIPHCSPIVGTDCRSTVEMIKRENLGKIGEKRGNNKMSLGEAAKSFF